MSLKIMRKNFKFKEPHYSLRNNDSLINKNVRTVLYRSESISALATKLWNLCLP